MKKYDPNYKVKTREEAKQIFEETLFLPRTDHLKHTKPQFKKRRDKHEHVKIIRVR